MTEFKNWIEHQFVDGMSWSNRSKWHLDHVKPCSSFDLTKDDEVLQCFHWSNYQPLWAIDNMKKGSKIYNEYILAHKQKIQQYIQNTSAQAKEGELRETPIG